MRVTVDTTRASRVFCKGCYEVSLRVTAKRERLPGSEPRGWIGFEEDEEDELESPVKREEDRALGDKKKFITVAWRAPLYCCNSEYEDEIFIAATDMFSLYSNYSH